MKNNSLKTKVLLLSLPLLTSSICAANVDKTDALDIAINYVKLNQKDSSVTNYIVRDIKDADSKLRAFEVSLFNVDKPVGYINIPVEEGNGVVSSYRFSGRSPSAELESKLKKVYPSLDLNNFTVVGFETGAVGFKMQKWKTFYDFKLFKKINGHYIFSAYPEYLLEGLTNKHSLYYMGPDSYRLSAIRNNNGLKEERAFREKMIKGIKVDNDVIQTRTIINPEAFINLSRSNSSGVINGSSTTAASRKFSPYNQERRKWSAGTCYSGCTPVAYAILFEYWDRHGFPKMLGSSRNNSYSNYRSSVVRNMVDKIRDNQGTFCTSNGEGSTYVRRNPDAARYIHSRGYRGYISNSRYGRLNSNAWEKLKSEINNNRPVVASVSVSSSKSGSNHSVVVYGYKDAPGTANDVIYYINGWGSNRHNTLNRAYHYHTADVRIASCRRRRWFGMRHCRWN